MRSKTQIRITSGEHGGQYLDTPKTKATQPMGERERIAIFNQIRSYLPGSKILDAFAGSGVLGITALSDGANYVDFLEKNPDAIKAINVNLKKHEYDKNALILRSIETCEPASYDLIFADPPYGNPQYDLIQKITSLLKPGGIMVLSHPQQPEAPKFENFEVISDRKYAAACIKIMHKIK